MTVSKQIDFELNTVVSPEYLDRIQEIQAGLAWGISLSIVGTTVTLTVPPETGSSSLTIQSHMRYIEASISVSFGGGDASGTYGIWAVTTATDDPNPGFTLAKVLGGGNPAGAYFRKLATVVWDQSALKLANLVSLVLGSPSGIVSADSITDDAKRDLILLSQVFS